MQKCKYPSVTTCLGVYVDFSMIPPGRLEFACARGSKIHQFIEDDLTGKWIIPDLITPEIEKYWESYTIFRDKMIDRTIFAEKELICKEFGYVGHVDWVGVLKGQTDGITVIDWKSPVQEGRTWCAQLCAYAHLVEKHSGIKQPVTKLGTLRLSPAGKAPKWSGYTKDRAFYFNAFLNALGAYRVFTGDN